MGKIITELGLTRFDKDWNLLERRKQPARSWIKHFFDVGYHLFSHTSLAAIPDIGNTGRTIATHTGAPSPNWSIASPGGMGRQILYSKWNSPNTNYDTPLGGQNNGIIIGTGNAAVTTGDYALQTRINHGEAAGEMVYAGTEIYLLTFANPNGSMVIRRFFENLSGGGITVEECGIYSPAYISDRTTYQFCLARDLTGGVVVADTEILEVTYTVQITV